MSHVASDQFTRIEHRLIGGREARVRLEPDRIHVTWRPNRAMYVAVGVGDLIRDAAGDVPSTHVDAWRVTEITPDEVVGEHVRTGDRREWNRVDLERGLALGNYSTNLTGFEFVTAYRVGSWNDYGTEEGGELAYHGRPYVTVVVYGNDGQKYGRRYRFVEEGNHTDVELAEQDVSIGRLDAVLGDQLDEMVRAALEDDGHVVHGG